MKVKECIAQVGKVLVDRIKAFRSMPPGLKDLRRLTITESVSVDELTAAEQEQFFFAAEILIKLVSPETEVCQCEDCANVRRLKNIIATREGEKPNDTAPGWKDPDS